MAYRPEINGAVLQLASLGEYADATLQTEFDAMQGWTMPAPESWAVEDRLSVRVLVTSVRHGCEAGLLQKFPRLQAICSWGAGYDSLPVQEARRRGILVSNTPGVLDECVADMAWALLLASSRTLCAGNAYVKTGRWLRNGEYPLSRRAWGKRLGILGLGRIGSAIARRGVGFGMEIRYHARKPRGQVGYEYEGDLQALAAWSDFLVVACVGGEQTRGLVSESVLQALGPQGILINIARGSVVDEAAMIRLLEHGQLGGAGLDVVQGEPGAPLALRNLDNVVLMPHVGSATYETRLAMEQLVVDNVREFMRNARVLSAI